MKLIKDLSKGQCFKSPLNFKLNNRDYKLYREENLFIRAVFVGTELMVTVYCSHMKRAYNYYFPTDHQVEVIENEKLVNEYEEYIMSRFTDHLNHGGMTVGSDPEMFVEDDKGVVIPAFDFLDKKGGEDTTAQGTYGNNSLYWDGFQAEFETRALGCLGWHVDSIQTGVAGLYRKAIQHNKNAKLSSKTTIDIPMDMLKKAKNEHVAFGCNPSLNIYNMQGLVLDGREVPFRSAGGHIHLGLAKDMKNKIKEGVRAMDYILALAWVGLFEKYDDPRRRTMYGLAGEYRTPTHGVEYRVLSNAWLFHPLLTNLTFDTARMAFMFGVNDLVDKIYMADQEEVINAINGCDVKLARKILVRNEPLYKKIWQHKYYDEKFSDIVFKACMEGVDTIVADMTDVANNWNVPKNNWVTHSDGKHKNVVMSKKDLMAGVKVS